MDQCSQQAIPPVVTVSSSSDKGTVFRNGSLANGRESAHLPVAQVDQLHQWDQFRQSRLAVPLPLGWLFHSH
jgi:hypothetical protein